MEIQIKRAVKSGNSSAVMLPRSWLNKEIRVELIKKTPDRMLIDVLDIIKKDVVLSDILGIYLVGSYARGEEDSDSDIDILVITNNTDKPVIAEGVYNILVVSSELLNQKLKNDLFPIGQMIREAKPLLNSSFLKSVSIEVTKKNTNWYIDTTQEKIKMINKIIRLTKERNIKIVSDRLVYTLILRIRTLYIIELIINKKNYSKKDFISLIKNVSDGNGAYEGYLAIKNNLNDKKFASIEEVEKLTEYLKNQLVKVRKLLK